MAAVMDKIVSEMSLSGLDLPDKEKVKARIKEEINDAAWRWFMGNQEDVIFERKILFLSLKVQVKHLKKLFEKLFGPEPSEPF